VASERAAEIAKQISQANLELIQVVRGCSEEQWRTLCNDEGDNRTVAVIAHHVAHNHVLNGEWLDTALSGAEVAITMDAMNVINAEHSATYHDVAREETIRLLEENGAHFVARVGALDDEELARTAYHRGAGREMTVDQYAFLDYRHVAGHLATIRKALDLD
jgi:DinB superfamily